MFRDEERPHPSGRADLNVQNSYVLHVFLPEVILLQPAHVDAMINNLQHATVLKHLTIDA